MVMSPEWWMNRLDKELRDRNLGSAWSRRNRTLRRGIRPGLDVLAAYRRGEPPLPPGSRDWEPEFWEFLRMARLSSAGLVVESVCDRITPVAWTTGVESDTDGDAQAARINGEQDLVGKFRDGADDMLTLGDTYAIVGNVDKATGVPLITSESPHDVITAEDTATGVTLAGYKRMKDEWTGEDRAYLYLPGRVLVAVQSRGQWRWDDNRSGGLPIKGVAVFRARNALGAGDFERHLDVIDRINDDIFNRVTITKHQAFRQRGIELPDKDEKGRAITYDADAFSASPGSLWQLPMGAKVWESMQADLSPIRMIIRDDLEYLAAVTKTPLYYLNSDAANQSAAGTTAAREAHIFRVEDRMQRLERFQARVLSAAFEAMGDAKRAQAWKIRTIWKPTERFSLTEKGDALVKFKSAGYAFDTLAVDIAQYEPAALPRLNAERAKDLIFQAPVTPSGA